MSEFTTDTKSVDTKSMKVINMQVYVDLLFNNYLQIVYYLIFNSVPEDNSFLWLLGTINQVS